MPDAVGLPPNLGARSPAPTLADWRAPAESTRHEGICFEVAGSCLSSGGSQRPTLGMSECVGHVQPTFARDTPPGAQSFACYAITARVQAGLGVVPVTGAARLLRESDLSQGGIVDRRVGVVGLPLG
jgi:hypothetical protein